MTTHEHRLDAALAILAAATGPLTPKGVAGRLCALGHHLNHAQARSLLERLVHRGLAESRADTFLGCYPSRIYWPTTLGRREAQALEAGRLDGV